MKQSSSRPGGINRRQFMAASAASLAGAALARPGLARAAGYPSEHPIQFIVPFPAGGGTDLVARPLAQGIGEALKQSVVVINKGGGAGAEGFLEVKGAKGDPHKIIITLSNLFTTPLHTGVPFSWKDLTPLARLALDQFILWVNADTPYKTAKEYVAAVKEKPGSCRRAPSSLPVPRTRSGTGVALFTAPRASLEWKPRPQLA